MILPPMVKLLMAREMLVSLFLMMPKKLGKGRTMQGKETLLKPRPLKMVLKTEILLLRAMKMLRMTLTAKEMPGKRR